MPALPKKLHFIWVGGDMPRRNRTCVESFATRNPTWEINLWIDKSNLLAGTRRGELLKPFRQGDKFRGAWVPGTAPDGDSETIAKQVGGTSSELFAKRSKAFVSLRDFAALNNIRLRNANEVSEEGVAYMFSQYRREMRERGTNFGAASDILRILILKKEGGIYLDTDVMCNQPLPVLDCPANGALWSMVPKPGEETCTEAEWNSLDWWAAHYGSAERPSVCNSTIACHPNSAALETYRQVVRRNYQGLFSDDNQRSKYYEMANIRGQTIKITGPTAASEAANINSISQQVYQDGANMQFTLNKKERIQAKFHKNTWKTNRLRSKQAAYWGGRWLELKDEMFFPIYLIRDQFFHDWL